MASIFRSIATGDSTLISERKTIGENDPPQIHIQIDADDFHFDGTAWNRKNPAIEIFDSTFINQNVYAGYYVDVEHKRGLYRFLVGQDGVKFAEQIDAITVKISSEVNPEINRLKDEILSRIEGSLTLEKFVDLEKDANLLNEIKKVEDDITALHDQEKIANYSLLRTMELPIFVIDGLVDLLQQSISTVSQEAVNKVKAHIESCMDAHGETWIRTGIGYVKENVCPFCGQLIEVSDLAKTYGSYFSDAYKELKTRIQNFKHEFEESFSDRLIQNFIEVAGNNSTTAEFWRDYLNEVKFPEIVPSEYVTAYEELRQQVLACLDRKIGNPLDQIDLENEFLDTCGSYVLVLEQLKQTNSQIESINTIIQNLKTKTEVGDLVQAEAKLILLKNIRSRYSDEVANLCNDYIAVQNEKKDLEKTKSDLRSELDTYTTNLLSEYGTKLNHYLEVFSARFRIQSESKVKYSGGKPSTQYFIEINGQRLELGDEKTTGEPSFRTLLSEGDKHTLALAFFMTRLSLMSDSGKLKDIIVVFDDPVSSLDLHRRQRTHEQICKVAREAKQVNVLSHDSYFAKDLKGAIAKEKIALACLQININKDNQSRIETWNVDEEVRSDYLKDFFTLVDFRDNGARNDDERRKIARAIRPAIETYYKVRFPEDFANDASLGTKLIGRIEKAQPSDRLYSAQTKLPSLKSLNEYSKKYHHNENPGTTDTCPISDTELRSYVEQALKHINE